MGRCADRWATAAISPDTILTPALRVLITTSDHRFVAFFVPFFFFVLFQIRIRSFGILIDTTMGLLESLSESSGTNLRCLKNREKEMSQWYKEMKLTQGSYRGRVPSLPQMARWGTTTSLPG